MSQYALIFPRELVFIICEYEPLFLVLYNYSDWHYFIKYKSIFLGCNHSVIRLADGTLMSCGYNMNQQARVWDNASRNKFGKMARIGNMLCVVCGDDNTIVQLVDGTIMSCGRNKGGKLGLGDYYDRCVNKFEKVKRIPQNVYGVYSKYDHTIIQLCDGTLMSCGYNLFGELGHGDTMSKCQFEEIRGISKNISSVVCGRYYTIIWLIDGTMMSCGCNYFGQLGHGDKENRVLFEQIGGVPKNISSVVCGEFYTIILLSDGVLMSCGGNKYGQLGHGDRKDRLRFEEIKGVKTNIVEVVCGVTHSIIRLTDGTLMSCGNNDYGQLGHGDIRSRLEFTQIEGIKNVAEVACGDYYTMIRLIDGTLMGCGYNECGQLGLNDYNSRYEFEQIKLFE